MKKFISSILVAVLLFSVLAVNIFAADDKVVLSLKGAEGKPGDIVEVQIFLDENPGLWACGFDVVYNASYFQLGDVENGDVFSDAAFTKSLITPTGSYRFLAMVPGTSFENVYETGLLCTLRFKILEAAPNGNHNISIQLTPGNNIVRADSEDEVTPFKPEIDEPAFIKVSGSEATAPVTDASTTSAENTEDKSEDTTGRPVTAYVTDADNYVVRDDDNVPVTQVVTKAVTDEDGDPVYDENGDPVTEIVTETLAETHHQDPDDEEEGQKNIGMKKIILIVGIILLVVAAAVIVVILFNARKKDDASKDDKTNTNDSDKQE